MSTIVTRAGKGSTLTFAEVDANFTNLNTDKLEFSSEPVRHSVRPSLLLDFANTKQLDPRITFTRASTATFYDGRTTALAEQNLVYSSQALSAVYWGFSSVTQTPNATTAPDGTTTASLIVSTATTAQHLAVQSPATLGATGNIISFYAKPNGTKTDIMCNPNNLSFSASFNVSTGTVSASTGVTASITSAGNGWYRCVMVHNTATFNGIYIWTENTASSVLGDGVNGFYVWGVQLENRTAVSAYTPTTTAAITNYIPALQTAASGVARFDHNPTTGESLGLLIEEQRTNLFTYSDDFSNAAWVVNGTPVITSNQLIAPDGTLTADTVAVSGSSSSFGVYRNVATSGTYASSLYFKLTSGSFVLRVGLSGNYSEINCSTLAITNTGTGIGSVSSVGNSWYRFVSVGTVSVLSASLIYNVGTNTGTIAIWGAQLEAGAFATSYIPTVASQVTRPADNASITGTNFSSWYNTAEGTLYSDYVQPPTVLQQQTIVLMADELTVYAQRVELRANNANTAARTYINSPLNVCDFAFSPIVAGSSNKIVIGYSTNNFTSTFNAQTVQADTLGAVPPSIAAMKIGALGITNYLNGTIRKIAYYPKRLTNAELQGLTTV